MTDHAQEASRGYSTCTGVLVQYFRGETDPATRTLALNVTGGQVFMSADVGHPDKLSTCVPNVTD